MLTMWSSPGSRQPSVPASQWYVALRTGDSPLGNQRSVSAGDLYMGHSSPAMDQGSVANWIRTLDAILGLSADHFVPGHFEVGSHKDFRRFRDYLADLYAQVDRLFQSGATVVQVRQQINMKKYADFRQYPQFQATFADNAEVIFHQLEHSR